MGGGAGERCSRGKRVGLMNAQQRGANWSHFSERLWSEIIALIHTIEQKLGKVCTMGTTPAIGSPVA